MPTYNLADLFETLADAVPDRLALATSDGLRLTYREMDERGNRLAHVLAAHGVRRGDRVVVLARNRIEWLDALLGCFKVAALPVNLNFRYRAGEIAHVLTDADPAVVLVEREWLDTLRAALDGLDRPPPDVLVLAGDEPFTPGPGFTRYDDEVEAADPGRGFAPRSGDEEYLLYTGGTTGLPKGVLWTHRDLLFGALGGGGGLGPPLGAPGEVLRHVEHPPEAWMAIAPLMHGNGQWAVWRAWCSGGTAVVWTGRRFDAEAILDTAARERVRVLILVGDVMARPLLDALRAAPGRWDLAELAVLASGGAVLSDDAKRGLAELVPGAAALDGYGASETGNAGTMTGSTGQGLPSFTMNPSTAVLDDDLDECAVGVVGALAVSGPIPKGYWRNEPATAGVFRTDRAGVRWSIPGDRARRNPDGTITLLGRGSLCINTGGEKVYPDEVETALKSHPSIADALVVGVPDPVLGERVAAVVEPRREVVPDLAALGEFVRGELAGYKVPRRIVVVDAVRRSPAGKADYSWARAAALGTEPTDRREVVR